MRLYIVLLVALGLLASAAMAADKVTIVADAAQQGPVGWGIQQLKNELKARGVEVTVDAGAKSATNRVVVTAGDKKWPDNEAFELTAGNNAVTISGSGDTGAMYGLLEIAETVRYAPKDASFANLAAMIKPKSASPAVRYRGMNNFLHVQPLFDPTSWYYQDDYWEKYLDLLAWSRINFLDWHATYDFETTAFPNIFPYIIKSDQFPQVGVPDEQKERNLAIFKKCCKMARERGIRVGLMSYIASWKVPGNEEPPYEESDANLIAYTREVVRKIVDEVPELDVVGFRIGESGRPENFYDLSYIPGLLDAKRECGLYTRTWVATPEKVRGLAKNYPGKTILEIKYNGEHLGMPYIVQGERMSGWSSYSYQDYMTASMNYDVVWQIRINGTNTMMRWADPEYIRRIMTNVNFAGADGYSMEPMDVYYPKEERYTHNQDHGYKYQFERDWFWHLLWGRLGYDPTTPESLWVKAFEYRMPGRGEEMYRNVVRSSQVVPWIYNYHCMGADSRNMSPEFEWGGDLDYFLTEQPLDPTVIRGIGEMVGYRLSGGGSARAGAEIPLAKFDSALALAEQIERSDARKKIDMSKPGAKEEACILEDAVALGHLGAYYSNKIRAAIALGLYRKTMDRSQLDTAADLTESAIAQWTKLAEINAQHYKPFQARLRMGDKDYTWATQLPKMEADRRLIAQAKQQFAEWIPPAGDRAKITAVPTRSVRLVGKGPEEMRLCAPFSTVTVASTEKPTVTAWYRQTAGDWVSVPMAESSPCVFTVRANSNVKYAVGSLDYYYEAKFGDRSVFWPADPEGNAAPITCIVTDKTPALSISDLTWKLNDKKDRVKVEYRIQAEAGIKSAHIKYKTLPSTSSWQTADAAVGADGIARGEFPVTSIGAVFCVYVYDRAAGGLTYPYFMEETPYRLVPAW